MEQRSIIWLIFFTVACAASSSCQTVKYEHPGTKVDKEIVGKSYNNNGVKFSYPNDWRIVEDKISENNVIHIVVADAPFCFVRFKMFSSEIPIDLRREAEYVDKKMQRAVEKSFADRTSSVNRNIQGQNYEGLKLKGSFSTSDVTLTDSTEFFLVKGQKHKALIIINAGDEGWKVADKEFQFILNSLKIE